MRRILKAAAIGILGVVAIVYVAATGFLVYNEDSMVFGGANLGEDWPFLPPDTVSIPWDTVRVHAGDGVPVILLESRVASASEAPWVVYFHGNGQLLGDENSIGRYRLLHGLGLNVLAVEYRGYGVSRSAGPPSEDGIYADGLAGWTYLTEQLGVASDRIVLFGMSLGAGVVTHLATRVRPAGLITEGAFTTLPATAQRIYPWLPISLVMRNRFDNLERAATFSAPWLLLHSRDDEVVPFSHAEALAEEGRDVELVELTGSHAGGLLVDEGRARAVVREFLSRVFDSPGADRFDGPG